MHSYRLFTLVCLLTCSALYISCGDNGPTRVESITLALDDSGEKGDEVEGLKPNDNPFHAIIHLNNMGSGETVRMDFIAIGADSGKDLTVLTQGYEVGGINNQVDFTISLPRPWPVGPYRIDAYLHDTVSMTKQFNVTE